MLIDYVKRWDFIGIGTDLGFLKSRIFLFGGLCTTRTCKVFAFASYYQIPCGPGCK